MKNITEEIKSFLSSTGLKQCLLAKEAGVSTATVNRLYREKQHDVMESRASALRAAMSRLSQQSFTNGDEPCPQSVNSL